MPVSDYKYNIVSHSIGKHVISIAEIENLEILFEEYLKKDPENIEIRDEQIPYWGELWPSSLALSEFLVENKKLVAGKKAIEIGCGLGLPGIVAAKLGANVLMTDYLEPALEFAAFNWKLNFNSKGDFRLLDWRSPENIIPADVLIASDIAYESRTFVPLLNAFNKLVKTNGVILLSEPNRKFTKKFFTGLEEAGFKMKEENRKVIKNNIGYTISIYTIFRRQVK